MPSDAQPVASPAGEPSDPATKERVRRLPSVERRKMVVAAGMEVFAEHGYDHATLAEIGSRAGISKSTLYDHLESKQSFHLALLGEARDQLVEHLASQVDSVSPEVDPIFLAFHAYFSYVRDYPNGWRMLFADTSADPEVARAHDIVRTEANLGLVEVMADAAPAGNGLISDTRRQMVGELVGAAMRQLAQWWLEHPEVDQAEVEATARQVLWTGLAEPKAIIDLAEVPSPRRPRVHTTSSTTG